MGEEMVVDRIGVTTECMMGGTRDNGGNNFADDPDIISVICAGHVRIVVNGLLLSEGPMIKYASGYGLSGYVSGTGVTFNGIFNIGVPSQASVPKLVKTQTLTERHEVIGFLTFYSRAWADAVGHEVNMPYINKTMFLPVKCWLHGLIKTAVNK